MSEIAIRVEGLGKRYRIPHARRPTMLREALVERLRAAGGVLAGRGRPPAEETFWALRDVGFEVRRGEAVGIVGGNGAGKSTLLKVLSRITEPTEGDAWIRGRVGSLLEVGTGFHAELTGRENTYLNGAILGMKRAEIDRKFDEIVAFAGVERFIDTPVKHYSSGMYLRLAFAVAAHLEPEILVVDEVLAVGDAAFQRKCLGRMEDVAREGRTVLFVSHNMDAIQRLCSRCVLLDGGRVAALGESRAVVAQYLARGGGEYAAGSWIDLAAVPRSGSGEVRFRAIRYGSPGPDGTGPAYPGGPLRFELVLDSDAEREVGSMAVSLRTPGGTLLINADVFAKGRTLRLRRGRNTVAVQVEDLPLNPGVYSLGLWTGDSFGPGYDAVPGAFEIEVVPMHGGEADRVYMERSGLVACRFDVVQEPLPDADGGREPGLHASASSAGRA
ncbi:MAG TPA: polysaccharide ABC transporter ATP-binding protein [Longimicrobiaceae bacterium]|nr:polysaccharide ABC transporter ATP-binding protein [Longimicrobiaceae bacterium]